jgi:hypothetical protein
MQAAKEGTLPLAIKPLILESRSSGGKNMIMVETIPAVATVAAMIIPIINFLFKILSKTSHLFSYGNCI